MRVTGHVVFGLAAMLFGLAFFAFGFQISEAVGAAPGAGPRVFPQIAGLALALVGLLYALGESRRAPDPAEASPPMDWRGFAWAFGGIAGFVLLLEKIGFIAAETLLFAAVARAFESRRPGRDLLIGLVIAIIVFLVFTQFLGLRLPLGDWPQAMGLKSTLKSLGLKV